MQLSRNSLHKLETNLSEFYFNLLSHGIQDGFVFSFRKKEMYLYFQLENTLRLFEITKMIFKKCIRIVKETYNLTSTKDANFILRRLYRYSYKMCSILNGYDQNEM